MLFTVEYRSADGALTSEVVEAADRSGCFAQMKARGISVHGVKDGGGRPRQAVRAGRSKDGEPSRRHALEHALFAAAIVAAVAAGWWFLARPVQTKPSEQAATVKAVPAKVKAPGHIAAPSRETEKPAPPKAPVAKVAAKDEMTTGEPDEMYLGSKVVGREVRTNRWGEVNETLTTADGRTHLVQRAEKPVFDNAADQILAMALEPSGGVTPPLPLRPGLEKDFRKAIERPIIIHEDEPESVKAAKRRVIEARVQMKEMLDRGMSFEEVLREHQRLSNENARMRIEAMRDFNALVNAGDIEGARTYAEKVNGTLSQLGIAPLTVQEPGTRRRGGGTPDDSAQAEDASGKENGK